MVLSTSPAIPHIRLSRSVSRSASENHVVRCPYGTTQHQPNRRRQFQPQMADAIEEQQAHALPEQPNPLDHRQYAAFNSKVVQAKLIADDILVELQHNAIGFGEV